jgi:hypothetical protein
MKIGAISDSLGALSFDELLGTAAELGIERSEFVAGPVGARDGAVSELDAGIGRPRSVTFPHRPRTAA